MNTARLLVVVGLLVIPAAASAGREGPLVYHAPDGCPSRSEFEAAGLSRGADLDVSQATPGHRLMVLSIRSDGGTFRGSVHIRDDQGETNRRAVSATSCSEVAD